MSSSRYLGTAKRTVVFAGVLCVAMILSLVASAEVQIPTGYATGTYTVTHSNLKFDARGATGEYVLSAVTTKTTGVAKGRFLLVPFTKPYDVTSANVLGREKQGSLIVALARSAGGADLTVSLNVNDKVNNRPLRGSSRYVVPLRFTRGTWVDYTSGKDVQLAVTAEGAANYAGGMGDLMLKVFTEGLAGGIEGINIQTNVDSVRLGSAPVIQANLKAIAIPSLVTNYVLSVKSYSSAGTSK